MNRKLSFLLLLFLTVAGLQAQDAGQFTNYMFIEESYNPAGITADNKLSFTGLYRAQWVGIEGSPSVQLLAIHSPLNFFNSSLGLVIKNEMQGAERNTHFNLSYAYSHPLRHGNIAGGIGVGIIQKSIDGEKLRAPQGDIDGSFNYNGHNDGDIPSSKVSAIAADISLGVYFRFKKLNIGLGANNLLEGKINYSDEISSGVVRFSRHYVLNTGYRFDLNRKLNLQANVLLKTDLIKIQTDYSLLIQYNSNIYGGVAFRGTSGNTNDALSVLFGFKLFRKLGIGYSYDFSLSALNDANSGSHEVYVSYKINLRDLMNPGKIIYNPRFL